MKNKNRICRRSAKSVIVDVTIPLRKDVYDELKVMARAEFRSLSQQIKYLMSLGKDLIMNSNGAIISRASSAEKEESQLESAIGFKIGE